MLRSLLIPALLMPLSASALDLVEVLELAEQHDASFQTAQADYRATLAEQGISAGEMLPQIDFNAFVSETRSTTSNSTSVSSPNGDSDFGAHGYSLTLSQTLYDKSVFDSADADQARSAEALAVLESARQTLYIRIAEAYFALADAEDAVEVAEAEKQAFARQLEQANERFKAGIIPSTDVRESQAQYDLSIANSTIADNDLDNAREALRSLIDQVAGKVAHIRNELPLSPPQPDDISAWTENAIANNLELQAARSAVDAAQYELDSARGAFYPTLSLDAEHRFTSSEGSTISNAFSGRDIDENRVSLNLDIPIYAGGSNSAKVKREQAELDAARAALAQQLRLTTQAVRSAFLSVNASISRVRALRQALDSTRLAAEATELSFRAGRRTSVDVLDAKRDVFAARKRFNQARHGYLLNTLKLKQAAGSLTGDDLLELNQYLATAAD